MSQRWVDLVDMMNISASELYEIKSFRTFRNGFTRHLDAAGTLMRIDAGREAVIMRSGQTTEVAGLKIWRADDWTRR